MPTLNWIDKDAVVKHHQDVPYRLLEPVPALSCGTASNGNLIVQGDKGETVAGLSPEGSGFQYCTLSAEPLFTPQGEIREDVRYAQLAEFVWFAETGGGYTPNALDSRLRGTDTFGSSPLQRVFEGRASYLLYNGILKDKSVAGGNVLTGPVFDVLAPFDGPKTIYAACRLDAPRLQREQIAFKQTPYALTV